MTTLAAYDPDGEPLMVGIPQAAKMLGLGRALAYELAKKDQFPVPVVKMSARCWRVSLVQIRRLIETGERVA